MPSIVMIVGAVALASASAIADPAFPDRLHGQWTNDRAGCAGEDTGGMRVSDRTIAFYESVGTPNVMHETSDGTISAEMSYNGEGKSWTEANRFTIAPDRSPVRVAALGRTFTLQRCTTAATAASKTP